MDFSQRQLLCTFSTLGEYRDDISRIVSTYKISGGKIYVLQGTVDSHDIFLTYNVIRGNFLARLPKTISVHRKKDFNVIYSINALNLIAEEQHGDQSKTDVIDWSKYQNSVVMAHDYKLRVVTTKLLNIQRIEQ